MSRASDLANVIASGSTNIVAEGTATTNLQHGLAKATLRGNTDAVLTNSFNISGGTDVATGRYTYSLTNSFSSVAYVQSGVVEGSAHGIILTRDTAQDEAGTIAVEVATSTTALVDGIQNVIVHGNLA
jgi:hypothetical protein